MMKSISMTCPAKSAILTGTLGSNKPLLMFSLLVLLCTSAISSLSVRAAVLDNPSAVVGQVSTVLGKAWIVSPGAGRTRVERSASIHAGDRIETASNGYVHISFIDTARVSVRPESTLEIVRYEYNPDAPSQSVVRFDLKEGITRAISGSAAEEAKGNFRMNTPIAAIGVRGTDFVVSAEQGTVRALVNQGAIIIAPYSADCSVNTLGPCAGNALELSEGGTQIAQVNANAINAELLPAPWLETPDAMLSESDSIAEVSTESEEEQEEELLADSVSQLAVNQKLSESSRVQQITEVPPKFTPDVALTSTSIANSQLVWGRFGSGSVSNERISLPFSVASGKGEVTVGNTSYALFRVENGSKVVKAGLGQLGFDLDMAQAVFTSSDQSSLMGVEGGNLSIDFEQNRFSTSLDLSHALTGAVNISDSGRLFPGGYFHSKTDLQWVAGAVSLDGAEAGYFFTRTLSQGLVEGLTLWSAKP